MSQPALESILQWVRNPAIKTVVLRVCHRHRYPCRRLMDPAKVLAVPMGSQQWVQHFQVHHDGHGHRYPSRPLMDPAKPATEMIAVPRESTQCLYSLNSL